MKRWRKIIVFSLLLSVMPITAEYVSDSAKPIPPNRSRSKCLDRKVFWGKICESFTSILIILGAAVLLGGWGVILAGDIAIGLLLIGIGLATMLILAQIFAQLSVWAIGSESYFYTWLHREGWKTRR